MAKPAVAILLLLWILATIAYDAQRHRKAVIVFEPPPRDRHLTAVALQWE